MKLFLVLIILLFEVSKGAARPRKCFGNIKGYCRKKCRMGEIYEIACTNGKLCCVNEEENKAYQEVAKPPQPSTKPDLKLDYVILPTVTVNTIPL
ncbi:beta-defensin 128 [Sus scrofa]|uniref:Beta-defensin n=2 Tax=Sus scrofa TaxID=9823 RepID=A0A287BN95_PIG|nr:beta-defensin 128 [Sus scrofa]